jgi:hypothetical protein
MMIPERKRRGQRTGKLTHQHTGGGRVRCGQQTRVVAGRGAAGQSQSGER